MTGSDVERGRVDGNPRHHRFVIRRHRSLRITDHFGIQNRDAAGKPGCQHPIYRSRFRYIGKYGIPGVK